MTRGVQKTLRTHEEYLFNSRASKDRLGDNNVDVRKIFNVTTLHELDEEYSRKVFGFDSLQVRRERERERESGRERERETER